MVAKFIKSVTRTDDLPFDEKPHVAIVGRSNVGKSSLINHLTQQKSLAHVSSSPGRTQTVNLFEIDREYYLVDLPGYGYARKSQKIRVDFAEMVRSYVRKTKQLRRVLLMIDARLGPTDLDRDMLLFLKTHRIPFTIVANKVDKLSSQQLATLVSGLAVTYPAVPVVAHSVDSAKDRKAVWEAIASAAPSETVVV